MNPENALPKGPQIVSLADEEGVKQILVRTIFGLWEIVNDLTRLRPSQRERCYSGNDLWLSAASQGRTSTTRPNAGWTSW